eukprot:3758543-Ditylum_brightwellii.AAC.1
MQSIISSFISTPTSQTSHLALPVWIGEDQKVTLELNRKRLFGNLHLKEGSWLFSPHHGKSQTPSPHLPHLQYLLLPDWHSSFTLAAAAAH